MTNTHTIPQPTIAQPLTNAHPVLAQVERAIARRSFATLATVSPAGYPHAAGVVYAEVDGALWFSTDRRSRKARNLAANPRVHVSIPVRRAPVGPPSTIQFAATAELFAADAPEVTALAAAGRLKAITGHGELDLADGCFVRLTAATTIHTYGLGLALRTLIRDPLHAGARLERG